MQINSIHKQEKNKKSSHDQTLAGNLDFELAYRTMIGELAPSFLHELNNPLTVLSSSSGLLQKISQEDTDFDSIVANVLDGSYKMTRISDSFRRILNANSNTGISNIQELCKDLLLVWAYRFKKESLAPEVFIAENMGELFLSEKEFYFILFAILELCLQISKYSAPEQEMAHRLRIRLAPDKRRKVLLSARLPERICQKLSDENMRLKEAFFHFIPTFLANHISELFSFVLDQTYCIFRHRRINAMWQTEHREIILQVTLPVKTTALE